MIRSIISSKQIYFLLFQGNGGDPGIKGDVGLPGFDGIPGIKVGVLCL